MRDRIRELADQAWRGLDAMDELQRFLHENPKAPENDNPGPTEIVELTDHLWRAEHISRIVNAGPKPRVKRRRRTIVS